LCVLPPFSYLTNITHPAILDIYCPLAPESPFHPCRILSSTKCSPPYPPQYPFPEAFSILCDSISISRAQPFIFYFFFFFFLLDRCLFPFPCVAPLSWFLVCGLFLSRNLVCVPFSSVPPPQSLRGRSFVFFLACTPLAPCPIPRSGLPLNAFFILFLPFPCF